MNNSNGNFPPIGDDDKDNKSTHIGGGESIPTTTYKLMMSEKKPSVFVRDAAKVLFGEEILRISTITGKLSNRSRKSQKLKMEQKKLDPRLLNILEDFTTHYSNQLKFSEMSSVERNGHIYKIGTYMGGLISELKSKSSPSNGKDKSNEENKENENKNSNPNEEDTVDSNDHFNPKNNGDYNESDYD
ncbi:uncharacterized protein [Chelonus insularis]|uniref:uncharacterized protein n=1 Tax=Chelonus insularis TaxID=460826 RepID=UPI0015891934|nr:uncharacterized protein LOC118064636 [Chelonus insularis]